MIGALSGFSPYFRSDMQNPYSYRTRNNPHAQGVGRAAVMAPQKAAQPEVPVQPVRPASPVNEYTSDALTFAMRQGADPVEMAVRMRIQYPEDPAQTAQTLDPATAGQTGQIFDPAKAAQALDPAKAGQTEPLTEDAEREPIGVEGVQKALEEGQCQTCKERKYQDGSDDPGVSFKTATHIAPELAAAEVRGHEMEHVVREQASAQREDRRVVSQSVTYHTAICPECGKAYVSGGTTRTTTAANRDAFAVGRPREKGSGGFSALI